MGCLFGCFRVAGDSGEPRGGHAQAQLVSSSVVPATDPKVGERRPPSKNALSAVFFREDEESRVEQSTSSENESAARKMDQELDHEILVQPGTIPSGAKDNAGTEAIAGGGGADYEDQGKMGAMFDAWGEWAAETSGLTREAEKLLW